MTTNQFIEFMELAYEGQYNVIQRSSVVKCISPYSDNMRAKVAHHLIDHVLGFERKRPPSPPTIKKAHKEIIDLIPATPIVTDKDRCPICKGLLSADGTCIQCDNKSDAPVNLKPWSEVIANSPNLTTGECDD